MFNQWKIKRATIHVVGSPPSRFCLFCFSFSRENAPPPPQDPPLRHQNRSRRLGPRHLGEAAPGQAPQGGREGWLQGSHGTCAQSPRIPHFSRVRTWRKLVFLLGLACFEELRCPVDFHGRKKRSTSELWWSLKESEPLPEKRNKGHRWATGNVFLSGLACFEEVVPTTRTRGSNL